METENILKKFGNFILVFGIIGGIILIFTKEQSGMYISSRSFSTTNIILGLVGIISSVFSWIMCNWFSEMLENSNKKISLLYDLRNKVNEIEEKSETENINK